VSVSSIALLLVAAWVLASMKTRRFDGELVRPVHPYRRLMAHIMPARNSATVLFDTYVDSEELERYLAEAEKRFPIDITHAVVAGCFISLTRIPSMNRFVAGRRLYQRRWVEVTFSMKRKALDKKAKLANVKLRLGENDTFRDLCDRINEGITVERSDIETKEDKEYNLLTLLPRPMLRALISLAKWLDYYNLCPSWLIGEDPLYTSFFCANLGSLGMAAGYHHLYDWGHCPLFCMIGKIEERVVPHNGQPTIRRMLHLRFTYDERIDDGLNAGLGIQAMVDALEKPYQYLGCLHEDGSDSQPLIVAALT
jgi:hypothetical protein